MRAAPAALLLVLMTAWALGACGSAGVEPTCDDIEPPTRPVDRCADDQVLVRFAAEPECLNGRWIHTSENVDCGAEGERCAAAECVPVGCSGEDCAEPGDPCSSDFDCPVQERVFAECREDEVYAYADFLICDREAGVCVPDEVTEDCAAEGEICWAEEGGCFCETACSAAGSPSAYQRCEGEIAVSTYPVVINCRCENPRVERDCAAEGKVCSLGACFDPPEETCEDIDCDALPIPDAECDGDEALTPTGFTCVEGDEGAACEPVFDRVDCADTDEICLAGACVDPDENCGEEDCTALALPGPSCDGDELRTPERWSCDRSGEAPECVVEAAVEDCTEADEICVEDACVDPDENCGEEDCTALALPGPSCDGDELRTPERWSCDRSGESPECALETAVEDCTEAGEVCVEDDVAACEEPGSGGDNGDNGDNP